MQDYLRMRVLITEIAEGFAFQCESFSLLSLGENMRHRVMVVYLWCFYGGAFNLPMKWATIIFNPRRTRQRG